MVLFVTILDDGEVQGNTQAPRKKKPRKETDNRTTLQEILKGF